MVIDKIKGEVNFLFIMTVQPSVQDGRHALLNENMLLNGQVDLINY
jgi:hypothetical protein